MAPTRIAVIGAGLIGRTHIQVLRSGNPDYTLAAVVDPAPAAAEKPIADDVASALDLVEAAEKAGVPTLVGHHRRHNPIMRKAAEIIAGGGIGRVVAVNGLWLSHKPDPYFNITWRK